MSILMMPKIKGHISTSHFLNLTFYRSLVDALQYLTLIRPNLPYSVNFVSQFLYSPTETHFKMIKCVLRYVKGTVVFGLHFSSNFTLELYIFSDVDWAGCPLT